MLIRYLCRMCIGAAALGCAVSGISCNAGDALPRRDGGGVADVAPTDGTLPDPDVALVEDGTLPDPDAGADSTTDAFGPGDSATDGPLADAGHFDGHFDDASGVDVGVDAEVGPSPGCLPWLGVPDVELAGRLHASLHETYRPITAEVDLGGNLNRYTTARHLMFTEVEWFEHPEQGQGGHECVYTGRFVATPPGDEPDDEVMNCEHTWPRARMSPRDSLRYSHEQSDIHHLLPTISGANSLRGSERYGDVEDGRNLDYLPAVYGTDASGQIVFQPRRERQGDIARVIFYFSIRWGKDIRDDEERALRRWMTLDPVDRRERSRNDVVEGIQGNRNPFVDCPELVDRIADFTAFEPLDTDESLPAP